MTSDLNSHVILVTGAGDGLGRATALAAAKQGATVLLMGRTIKKLESTYDAIVAQGGPEPAILPLNLNGASWNDYQQVAETLEAQLGRLDAIIHCAAHFTGFVPFAEIPPKDWLDSLQTNLTGPYILTRCLLPLLAAAPAGRVIFCSDSMGRAPRAHGTAYVVAKAALEQLSASWALELGNLHPKLALATFNPGPMCTALRRKGYSGEAVNATPPPSVAAQRLIELLQQPTQSLHGKALS